MSACCIGVASAASLARSSVPRSRCPELSWPDGMRRGAFVVADNADYSPDYLARVRSVDGGYVSLPFDEDVELSMRLG